MNATSDSALNLLMPDPSLENPEEKDKENEDDELEALRQAALASMMKAKAPSFKVETHPKRSNLLCIVVEDQEKKSPPVKPVKSIRDISEEEKGLKLQGESPRRTKFDRFESSSETEEEEEVETETEIEVTDSETESNTAATTAVSDKKEPAVNMDDVLNVDCRDEVDEFSKFLNEFETELNDSSKSKNAKQIDGKKKKTKIVKKKKIVKRMVKKIKSNSAHHKGHDSSRSFSRSPTPPYRYGDRYSRSPLSPYRARRRSRSPPPYKRGYSPYRRPYSPPHYRYGCSPPRYRLSPPYRPSSPPFPPRRRSPLPPHHRRPRSPQRFDGRFKFSRRSDSAPKSMPDDKIDKEKPQEKREKVVDDEQLTKSKSLPPKNSAQAAREARLAREQEEKRIKEEKEKEKQLEFEERLKRLPTPDRERVLARRKKFESAKAVQPEKKVISLKNSDPLPELVPEERLQQMPEQPKKVRRITSEDAGDSISLSVDDTLDMFEEEESIAVKKRGGPLAGRIGKRADGVKPVTDLRVQLRKKRKNVKIVDETDSLEHAVVESSTSEDEKGDFVTGSTNRIVKQPSKELQDQRIIVTKKRSKSRSPIRHRKKEKPALDSPTKSSLKPSLAARLGLQAPEVVKPEVVPKKRKVASSSESPDKASSTPEKMSKKEKKKEKKEKKKRKKEKKEKKKKRKSKASGSDGGRDSPTIDVDNLPERGGNSSDEELWGFFENMNKTDPVDVPDKTDILLDTMRKKNEARLKRLKEIEEDKLLHK